MQHENTLTTTLLNNGRRFINANFNNLYFSFLTNCERVNLKAENRKLCSVQDQFRTIQGRLYIACRQPSKLFAYVFTQLYRMGPLPVDRIRFRCLSSIYKHKILAVTARMIIKYLWFLDILEFCGTTSIVRLCNQHQHNKVQSKQPLVMLFVVYINVNPLHQTRTYFPYLLYLFKHPL